jgi:hypothetical protein
VRVSTREGDVAAVIERIASLGWLSRLTLRLHGGEMLVAHVPHEDVDGAKEGDVIQVDLRNPKAFLAAEHAEDDAAPVAR